MSFTINPITRKTTNEKTVESEKFHNYIIVGSSQTRNGITFIENNYTARVGYAEDFSDNSNLKVFYNITNLEQSCDGVIFQFAQKFSEITSNLILKVNEAYEVEEIINHHEILKKWKNSKEGFEEEYKLIPKVAELLINYENSIANEEKLRKSIFYVGIAQLFFPRIKQLFAPPRVSTKFARTRNLHGYYFGIKIPVKEELSVKEI